MIIDKQRGAGSQSIRLGIPNKEALKAKKRYANKVKKYPLHVLEELPILLTVKLLT